MLELCVIITNHTHIHDEHQLRGTGILSGIDNCVKIVLFLSKTVATL